MTLHWDAVPESVAAVFRSVSPALAGSDFYLAGGTALALQLGHRLSVDLDLFSASFGDPETLLQLLQQRLPDVHAGQVAPKTLYATMSGVQVSFFGYSCPLLQPLLQGGPELLALAHTDDIATMKLAAIAGRGSRKDFVDLWFLLRRGRSLAEYLELFERKFAERDVGHVVRSLVFFDDADAEPALPTILPVDWADLKRDFVRWVEQLLAS